RRARPTWGTCAPSSPSTCWCAGSSAAVSRSPTSATSPTSTTRSSRGPPRRAPRGGPGHCASSASSRTCWTGSATAAPRTSRARPRQSVEDMQDAGEEMEPGKRDRRDFALWKAAKATEPDSASWDTPFGRGRPGWHLECSAMSRKYLGETFDIHAGGLDLRFPHHENEQAQSRAAGYGFARRWMHSGVLTVDGMKMGKSLDNFVTAARALAGHPTPAVRLALVSGHYRATVEYNATAMAEAETVWER